MKKTVIFTWSSKVHNRPERDDGNYFGIGDIFRGFITCYYICKQYNYEYIIDVEKHPISNYLNVKPHKYTEHVRSCNQVPFVLGKDLESFITNNKKDVIILMTNGIYPLEFKMVDEKIKEMLRNIFVKNSEFNEYYIKKKESLKLKDEYNICHFRLGDGSFVRNKADGKGHDPNKRASTKVLYEKIIKNKKDVLLLSDNNEFKKFVKKESENNKESIIINDIEKIAHIGYSKHKDILKDTLVEWFLVSECKSIDTYSVYHWPSGFVLYPSMINDIPINIHYKL